MSEHAQLVRQVNSERQRLLAEWTPKLVAQGGRSLTEASVEVQDHVLSSRVPEYAELLRQRRSAWLQLEIERGAY